MAAEFVAFSVIIFSLIILAIAVSVLATIFWIWMIVDCAKREFKKEDERLVWILIVVLAGIIGAIVYYFVVKIKEKK